MNRAISIAIAGFLLVARPSGELSAQLPAAAPIGEDAVSLALQFGAVSPNTTFSDGSSYEQGMAVGAAAMVWPTRLVGIRVHALRGTTDGVGGGPFYSPVQAQQPTVWIYGLDASVRFPMGSDGFGWFPYVSGGIAGKSYRWSVDRPEGGSTAPGYSVAGGVELRPGGLNPLGFILEGRMFQHRYDFMGLDEDYRDLLFTAGITLNH